MYLAGLAAFQLDLVAQRRDLLPKRRLRHVGAFRVQVPNLDIVSLLDRAQAVFHELLLGPFQRVQTKLHPVHFPSHLLHLIATVMSATPRTNHATGYLGLADLRVNGLLRFLLQAISGCLESLDLLLAARPLLFNLHTALLERDLRCPVLAAQRFLPCLKFHQQAVQFRDLQVNGRHRLAQFLDLICRSDQSDVEAAWISGRGRCASRPIRRPY
ncbi:hypothetical protein PBRA_003253 [Plasmodiophora brassicae]|uniref:Uncharacterized protein n=1 Tax=Plasmodiophora brassicae TaxID=37360 RepID=A0A0G4J8S2_PLABS|nr:hypothetical protein PBRA_003253 [Plasmodiophora brassicae]